ncbi:MAG TPA: protein-glutamate O-methyltransferase CheR [Myxococcaceae bacterium]
MSQLPGAWSLPGYGLVYEQVQRRAGLLAPSCVPAAEEGIDRAMHRAGCGDLTDYVARISTDPGAFDDLLTELTIGETYFFRTHEHFDFLRQHALPELRRLRSPGHTVRAWSAGCSSGEEPYSLAVLLREEGYGDRVEVLATDISRAALARAQEARYSAWSLRSEHAQRMRPYLRLEGKRYVLTPEVRQAVRFGYLNLALDTWPSPESGIHQLDLIFCRNVFIYFTRPTIESVARRLYESLAEGGFLITGPSDPALNGLAPFEPMLQPWGIAWRRPPAESARVLLPPAHTFVPPLPAIPAPPPPVPVPYVPMPIPEQRAPQVPERAVEDAETAVKAVRALANVDPPRAVIACAEAAARYPLSAELRYLEALLLLGLGRLGEAERAVRQILYLDGSLAAAHFTLGLVLRRLGDTAGALRAFRNVERLCAALPADAAVPLAEGERAGALVAGARAERERLEAADAREER